MAGRGMHGRGACMVRACMVGVCVAGACMVAGMHGGACMAGGMCGRGACMMGDVQSRYYEIWSMSGYYTSYWNAFLLLDAIAVTVVVHVNGP